MTDPNVTHNASGEEVILEPGDPGYVEPGHSTSGDPIDSTPETTPGPDEPLGAIAPPGEDLRFVRERGEDDATYAARTRNVAVVSESPTDLVPNTPQITMGERVAVEGAEGVVYARGSEPEELDPDALAAEAPAEEEEEE